MNDYEYNDMDSGIDWSSVTLPGEEINHSSCNQQQQQPFANSTPNAADPVNRNRNANSDGNNSISNSYGHQQQMIQNDNQYCNTAAPSIMLPSANNNAPSLHLQHNRGSSQEPVSVAITAHRNENINITQNPNPAVTKTNPDPDQNEQNQQQLLEQIQKLQTLLAEKDSKLFDLESTMATVEAEASFQIKQNQQHLDQQLRASLDTVRSLQKDVDSKNHAIVKLKKRNRQSMNGTNSASVNTPNGNFKANDDHDHGYVVNGGGVGMDIAMNAPRSPMNNRISNRDTVVSYPHHLPNAITTTDATTATAYPHEPTYLSVNGQGGAMSQNITLPFSKDLSHNVTTAEDRLHVNDVQQKASTVDVTSTNNDVIGNDIEMKDAQSCNRFERVIQSWKEEKYKEIMTIVIHLIRYNEHFLPTYLHIQESGLDLDVLANSMKEDRPCDNMDTEESVVASNVGDEGTGGGAAAAGIAKQDGPNDKTHSEKGGIKTMRDQYTYAVRIQSMLLHILERHSRPRCSSSDTDSLSRHVSMESTRSDYTPGIDYVVKELINMIASMEKIPLQSMVRNVVNSLHRPVPCLSILIELCSVSGTARGCIRSWLLCGKKEGVTASEVSNRMNAKNAILRIRGLPEKYEKHVQKLYYGNGGCNSDIGYTHERNLVCANFLETLLKWICGPEPKQYRMMSRQERIQVRTIQVQSMDFLNLCMLDAPRNNYLQLHQVFFRGVKEGVVETSYGSTDMISVLERSTVLAMTRRGHRHALIQQQWKEAILAPFVETGDFPNELLVKVKTQIVQLLAVFCHCPSLVDAIGNSSKLPRHHSNVSNLKRLVAAILDDLRLVVLPAISRPCPNETSSRAVFQYGSSAIQLLTAFSKSLKGFTMVRTQIKEGDLETDESRLSDTSIIAVVADILEISIHSIQLELSSKAVGKHGTFEYLRMQSLLLLMTRAINFFHSIQRQCTCSSHRGSQSSGSKKVKVHFSGILADAERSRSFFLSCQKVATMMPEVQSLDGDQNTIEPEVKLRARSMMQLLDLQ